MKESLWSKMRIQRVDAQVSLFTAVVVVVSCLCLYTIGYAITYNDMIVSLEDRAFSIYHFLEMNMDKSTFIDINSKADMEKASYKEMKDLFRRIKLATGVQYLYTAKADENGQFVYVIDGLDKDAADFRFPGDLIEEEIIGDLNRALTGELVLPKDIKSTGWGNIFITYMPIHNEEKEVVGVIGIEFEAEHQFTTYQTLRRMMPVVILLACFFSALFAAYFFRRLSNPHFQDLASTDYLTGLKNRNAYELDSCNLCAGEKAAGAGLILADLNSLKLVNDTWGHEAGDTYIKALAQALRLCCNEKEVLYRLGGDEFAVIVPKTSESELMALMWQIQRQFEKNSGIGIEGASAAFGCGLCGGNTLADFEEVYRKADAAMYEEKQAHYVRFPKK